MNYSITKTATFLTRPNRFIAHVLVDGREEIVHVKNTGRCHEILKAGVQVILEESANLNRKTRYSLIGAYKGDVLINIDSQIPNMVVFEAISKGKVDELKNTTKLSREVRYGNSRFDLYFECGDRKGYIEVKGVTLENDGVAMFPDAPTERGCKHVYEMIKAAEEGYEGYLFFLIQMKGVTSFTSNGILDLEFTKAISLVNKKGVTILAYDSVVKEDEITIGTPVDIHIN